MQIELSREEVNAVLQFLAEHPYKMVAGLVMTIARQIPQEQQAPPAAPHLREVQ